MRCEHDQSTPLTLQPIGTFFAEAVHTYDVPRQGVLADENRGRIVLFPGHNFEQALEDLLEFSHIWLLFWFNRNQTWRPKIQPPRHLTRKVGLFASRSPYRPNPIGMSAVKLLGISGRELTVAAHDLLDRTPILDIKPYLPYADAFPEASPGWTAHNDALYAVTLTPEASAQLSWLSSHGVPCLRQFILDHLSSQPTSACHHRLATLDNGKTALAYRTWRAAFTVDHTSRHVTVTAIRSAYSSGELSDLSQDKYGDKHLHQEFMAIFATSST